MTCTTLSRFTYLGECSTYRKCGLTSCFLCLPDALTRQCLRLWERCRPDLEGVCLDILLVDSELNVQPPCEQLYRSFAVRSLRTVRGSARWTSKQPCGCSGHILTRKWSDIFTILGDIRSSGSTFNFSAMPSSLPFIP